jgi:hypothetical protein
MTSQYAGRHALQGEILDNPLAIHEMANLLDKY